MKKQLIRFTAFIVLLGTMICGSNANAQKVTINETNFPDDELRRDLIRYLEKNELISKESDGNYYVETDKVDELSIEGNNIKGLELFNRLEYLDVKVTVNALDLTVFKNLKSIQVNGNNLVSILLPNSIVDVDIHGKFKTLDISKCKNLKMFCASGDFTSIDVSKNKKLEFINVWGSKKLKSIKVSKNNKKLSRIDLTGTKVSKLSELNNKDINIMLSMKKGSRINLNKYIGKGYKIDKKEKSDSNVLNYNNKGILKLKKKVPKRDYLFIYLKKGKKRRCITIFPY